MGTLTAISQEILNEKIDKIKPENIKKGITIFDVMGTLEPSSNIKTGDDNVTYNLLVLGSKYSGEDELTGINFYMRELYYSPNLTPATTYNGITIHIDFRNVSNTNYASNSATVEVFLYDNKGNLEASAKIGVYIPAINSYSSLKVGLSAEVSSLMQVASFKVKYVSN